MNVKDIIRSKGYDIMEERVLENRVEYDLRFSLEKREAMKEDNASYKFDIDGIHSVYVAEIGMNGNQEIFIVLNSTSDNSCWDVLE